MAPFNLAHPVELFVHSHHSVMHKHYVLRVAQLCEPQPAPLRTVALKSSTVLNCVLLVRGQSASSGLRTRDTWCTPAMALASSFLCMY